MKFTTTLGILFILFGIIALAYKGVSYTKEEKVAQLGELQITAQHEKTIPFPPLLGGLSVAAGIVLVVVSMGRNK